MNVLSAAGLSKRYVNYANNLQRFATWFGARISPTDEFWPVRNISFRLGAGEALAIVGQNGAGKSTLLKLITGTIRPTEGAVHLRGRVAAVLELGLGFNQDFTGRENVYLVGGLMGTSRTRLDSLMPQIEDFAEIGDFFDQPLRVYSSGMRARLAFALVTAERPEILILDEVLSVGDSYFQHKSFDRIRTFKEQGSAIILVSHALGDVRALCERVILLDKGVMLKDGQPDEVVDFYNALIATREAARLSIEQHRQRGGWVRTTSGTLEARVKTFDLLDATTRAPISTATVGQKLLLRAVVQAEHELNTLVLGLMLRDRTGHVVWGSNTWHTQQVIKGMRSGETIDFEIAFECVLGPGSYSFTPALTRTDTHLQGNYEWSDNALVFDVVNTNRPFFIGTSAVDAEFRIARKQLRNSDDRVAMTVSCSDCDQIPKVADAGTIRQIKGVTAQIMHNGLKVVAGGYHGDWMSKIISGLKGHHEPQEELVFHALLGHCRPNSLFVELGAFWAYYSLWYLQAVEGSRAICLEPDPKNLEVGSRNAALNGRSNRMSFIQAWIGEEAAADHEALAETVGKTVSLPCYDMGAIVGLAAGQQIEVLHIDAQGAELGFIRSMDGQAATATVRFLVVSTHHHSISGSATTHTDCLAEIRRQGGTVLAEHTIEESYSGDGLIVASFHEEDRTIVMPKMSRNSAENSLFGVT